MGATHDSASSHWPVTRVLVLAVGGAILVGCTGQPRDPWTLPTENLVVTPPGSARIEYGSRIESLPLLGIYPQLYEEGEVPTGDEASSLREASIYVPQGILAGRLRLPVHGHFLPLRGEPDRSDRAPPPENINDRLATGDHSAVTRTGGDGAGISVCCTSADAAALRFSAPSGPAHSEFGVFSMVAPEDTEQLVFEWAGLAGEPPIGTEQLGEDGVTFRIRLGLVGIPLGSVIPVWQEIGIVEYAWDRDVASGRVPVSFLRPAGGDDYRPVEIGDASLGGHRMKARLTPSGNIALYTYRDRALVLLDTIEWSPSPAGTFESRAIVGELKFEGEEAFVPFLLSDFTVHAVRHVETAGFVHSVAPGGPEWPGGGPIVAPVLIDDPPRALDGLENDVRFLRSVLQAKGGGQ